MIIDLNIPMPSISTLQSYARKVDLKQGILNDIIIFIEILACEFSKSDRECVLSFDEMKVCKNFEYDPAADEIVGPYSYLQIVKARGLFRNWKQPFFICFDQHMKKQIILEIVERLFEKGINVVAIVSDNCQANFGCWKDLGAHNYLSPHFPHPVTKKMFMFFSDAPHLLKLIRNWLLDTGFKFENNHISAHILRELVLERTKS